VIEVVACFRQCLDDTVAADMIPAAASAAPGGTLDLEYF